MARFLIRSLARVLVILVASALLALTLVSLTLSVAAGGVAARRVLPAPVAVQRRIDGMAMQRRLDAPADAAMHVLVPAARRSSAIVRVHNAPMPMVRYTG